MSALGLLFFVMGLLSGVFAAAATAILQEEWPDLDRPDRIVRAGLLGFLTFEAALLLSSGLLMLGGSIR